MANSGSAPGRARNPCPWRNTAPSSGCRRRSPSTRRQSPTWRPGPAWSTRPQAPVRTRSGIASTSATSLRSLLGQTINLHLELMIDADPVDSIRLHSGLRRAVHGAAVDHIVDLVAGDAHFERVHRFSTRIGFLDRVVRRLLRNVLGVVAVAPLDQPRAVLRHDEVQVALFRALEVAAAEDE